MLHVVEEPTRRGDDHVDAAAERVLLRAHADAAEHGGAADRGESREVAQVALDLGGELAGGRDDEGAHGAAGPCGEPLHDGQQERGGLATARHGAREHVASGADRRDGVALDRGGLGVAERLDGAQEGCGHT